MEADFERRSDSVASSDATSGEARKKKKSGIFGSFVKRLGLRSSSKKNLEEDTERDEKEEKEEKEEDEYETWRSVGHDSSPEKSERIEAAATVPPAVPNASTSNMSTLIDRWGSNKRPSSTGRKSFSDTLHSTDFVAIPTPINTASTTATLEEHISPPTIVTQSSPVEKPRDLSRTRPSRNSSRRISDSAGQSPSAATPPIDTPTQSLALSDIVVEPLSDSTLAITAVAAADPISPSPVVTTPVAANLTKANSSRERAISPPVLRSTRSERASLSKSLPRELSPGSLTRHRDLSPVSSSQNLARHLIATPHTNTESISSRRSLSRQVSDRRSLSPRPRSLETSRISPIPSPKPQSSPHASSPVTAAYTRTDSPVKMDRMQQLNAVAVATKPLSPKQDSTTELPPAPAPAISAPEKQESVQEPIKQRVSAAKAPPKYDTDHFANIAITTLQTSLLDMQIRLWKLTSDNNVQRIILESVQPAQQNSFQSATNATFSSSTKAPLKSSQKVNLRTKNVDPVRKTPATKGRSSPLTTPTSASAPNSARGTKKSSSLSTSKNMAKTNSHNSLKSLDSAKDKRAALHNRSSPRQQQSATIGSTSSGHSRVRASSPARMNSTKTANKRPALKTRESNDSKHDDEQPRKRSITSSTEKRTPRQDFTTSNAGFSLGTTPTSANRVAKPTPKSNTKKIPSPAVKKAPSPTTNKTASSTVLRPTPISSNTEVSVKAELSPKRPAVNPFLKIIND